MQATGAQETEKTAWGRLLGPPAHRSGTAGRGGQAGGVPGAAAVCLGLQRFKKEEVPALGRVAETRG